MAKKHLMMVLKREVTWSLPIVVDTELEGAALRQGVFTPAEFQHEEFPWMAWLASYFQGEEEARYFDVFDVYELKVPDPDDAYVPFLVSERDEPEEP